MNVAYAAVNHFPCREPLAGHFPLSSPAMNKDEPPAVCFLLQLPFLVCAKGRPSDLLQAWGFPFRHRKLEARPCSSLILITVISSRIKPYIPNGQDQTYLQLPKHSFRQHLCTYFQQSIQTVSSVLPRTYWKHFYITRQQNEVSMYGEKHGGRLGV